MTTKHVVRHHTLAGEGPSRHAESKWWVSLTQIEARSLSAIAVSGDLSLSAICPVCRLHGQVTADVSGGAARRWASFRVGDDTGVGRHRSTLPHNSRSIPASPMPPQACSTRTSGKR
jgi:hypothetical protein